MRRVLVAVALLCAAACHRARTSTGRAPFTPQNCPQARLEAFPHPRFGRVTDERYVPGEGERHIVAKFGPAGDEVHCKPDETDDACAARAKKNFEERDDVAAARALVHGDTQVEVAVVDRVARAWLGLKSTIWDEPRLDAALVTTSDGGVVERWASDAQKIDPRFAIAASEGSSGRFSISVRCR